MVSFPNEYYCSTFTGSVDLDWVTANQFHFCEKPASDIPALVAHIKKFFTGLF